MKVSIEFSDPDEFEAWIRWRSMLSELNAVHEAARYFLKNGAPEGTAEEVKQKLLQRAVVVIGEALYA